MAVSSLQALNVIGLMEHIDEAITALGESGVFQPDDVSNFYDNVQNFTHLQTKNTFAEPLTNLKAALNQTKRSFPLTDVSDFSPSVEDLENFSAVTTADIDALIDKRETAAAKLNEVRQNLSVTSHFVGMGVEIEKVLKMKYMKARFGRLPKDSMSKLEAYRDNEYVDFAVCTEDKTHCWGVYFAPFDVVEEIDKIFEALFFERCNLVSENETPRERIEDYKKEIPALEANVKKAQAELDKYLDENKEQITNYLSKLEELYLYASIRSKALQYNNSFIIVGWVPTENKKQLSRRLKKIRSIEVDFSDAKNELDKRPPVRLKNCFLAKPFEFYTEMYGVPEYNEIDPTLFIAFTYVVIFGIMFADLGQGLLLSVVGILMWKIKKMKVGRILFPCGISSAIFGTVFGSVFGFEHLLDPMFHALGFEEKPMQVMNPENTNSVILTAISIGVILLIVAMFLNVFSSLRQKNLGKALFGTSGLSGIVFYGAAI
ncbi:MAG: ATPase, partial [Ruminococcus sp.]|nr:ATPase [Ruminococcus sp.]